MVDEVAAPEAPPADAAPDVTAAKPPERNKGDERFNELTYRLKQAEATIAKLSEPKPVEKPPLVKPTLEQSGYDEDAHKAALDKFEEQRIEQLAEAKVQRALEERETKAKARSRDESFESRLAKLTPEQRESALRAPVGHEDVAELIKESELGPEILLYLTENPEIGENITKLSISQRAKEIGRIEARLEKAAAPAPKEPSDAPEPKPVTVSKAPPPASKLDASEGSLPVDVTSPESDKLSDAEWTKRRNKQVSRRG